MSASSCLSRLNGFLYPKDSFPVGASQLFGGGVGGV